MESVLHVPRRLIVETLSEGKGKEKTDVSSGAAYGTGEERIFEIREVLEELGKTLRRMSSQALRINAVIGIDPVFRFSEVGIVLPYAHSVRSLSVHLVCARKPFFIKICCLYLTVFTCFIIVLVFLRLIKTMDYFKEEKNIL